MYVLHGSMLSPRGEGGPRGIQLFREMLSNKAVRDNAERYYG